MKNKVVDIDTAIDQIKKNDTVLFGGFGNVGAPLHLLYALAKRPDIDGLTLVSEDMHYGGLNYVQGPEVLYQTGQLKKIIVSFIGSHKVIENAINDGKLELEFVPQGTLAERLRAAVEQGKETKIIDGKKYIFEKPLRGNVALVKAYKADRMGNAVFKLTAANFNPWMATAADTVILEVEQLVEVGEIDPDDVQLPGFFVDYIVVKEGAMF